MIGSRRREAADFDLGQGQGRTLRNTTYAASMALILHVTHTVFYCTRTEQTAQPVHVVPETVPFSAAHIPHYCLVQFSPSQVSTRKTPENVMS